MSICSSPQSSSSIFIKYKNGFIALFLFLLVLVSLTATEKDIGVTWDEPDYFVAGYQYGQWYSLLVSDPAKAFNRDSIDQFWDSNHLHPPVSKAFSGIAFVISQPFLTGTVRARLGNMIVNSLAISFIFLLVARQFTVWSGLLAAFCLLTLPRYFYHSHLSALDVPVSSLMVITLYYFWVTRDDRRWRYDIGLGLLFGLAVGTKINAAFIAPSLFIWTIIFNRNAHLFRRLLMMGVVGVITWVAIWPWMYFDTFIRIKDFIGFMTDNHYQIGQWYLGKFYLPPPWHFPWVMLVAVTPTVLMVFALFGTYATLANKQTRSFGGFLLIHALVPMLILSLGITMVYDNDRLFMPAFPFLMALAGIGIAIFINWLQQKLSLSESAFTKRGMFTGVVLLVLVFPYLHYSGKMYPHLLSYYSASVGGLPGAKKMGLEATYWSDTYKEVIPFINKNAKPDDIVWVQEWSQQVMFTYQFTGTLRADVKLAGAYEIPDFYRPWDHTTTIANYEDADFVVFQHRESYFGKDELNSPLHKWLQVQKPVMQIERDGVILLSVYQNHKKSSLSKND